MGMCAAGGQGRRQEPRKVPASAGSTPVLATRENKPSRRAKVKHNLSVVQQFAAARDCRKETPSTHACRGARADQRMRVRVILSIRPCVCLVRRDFAHSCGLCCREVTSELLHLRRTRTKAVRVSHHLCSSKCSNMASCSPTISAPKNGRSTWSHSRDAVIAATADAGPATKAISRAIHSKALRIVLRRTARRRPEGKWRARRTLVPILRNLVSRGPRDCAASPKCCTRLRGHSRRMPRTRRQLSKCLRR